MIATRVGGLGEVVIDGETRFLVPPDNARALADAIERFFSSDAAKRFVPNVQREKKKYTWESLGKAIEELASP